MEKTIKESLEEINSIIHGSGNGKYHSINQEQTGAALISITSELKKLNESIKELLHTIKIGH